MIRRAVALVLISFSLGFLSLRSGLNPQQALSISIFSASIAGSLLFWSFRLTFALLGTSALLLTGTVDLEHVLRFSSLEVILFLVGMMVLVGLLKEVGFFAWLVSFLLRVKNLTATKFLVFISLFSALLSCAVDEVTSIIFIVAAVFEICDYFELEPTPFVIISVFATNIGSSGTVLGNPIGVLIATKSGLTFEDFMLRAFPIMLLCLAVAILLLRLWYAKTLAKMDKQMKLYGANEMLIKLISVPPEKELKIGLVIFGLTLFFISIHHRIELFLGLQANTVLVTIPFISSALVMAWKHNKARLLIERDVDWWSLLFFLLLFAQAGTLKYTGATDILAGRLFSLTGNNPPVLIGLILWVAAIGSSMLDNVVLVTAFIPIIQSFAGLNLHVQPLWWALLFGGCLGGNITMIGSTANIVALGILEKERHLQMKFFRWFWVGLVIGVVTTAIVWASLVFLPIYK